MTFSNDLSLRMFTSSEPNNGYFLYHQVKHSQIPRSGHTVFMCCVWILEQTAIISLYNINWLVFITETVCLLRGTDSAYTVRIIQYWETSVCIATQQLNNYW